MFFVKCMKGWANIPAGFGIYLRFIMCFFIGSMVARAASLAFSAKSVPPEAYIICLAELMSSPPRELIPA